MALVREGTLTRGLASVAMDSSDKTRSFLCSVHTIGDHRRLGIVGTTRTLASSTFRCVLDFVHTNGARETVTLRLRFCVHHRNDSNITFSDVIMDNGGSSLPRNAPASGAIGGNSFVAVSFNTIVSKCGSSVAEAITLNRIDRGRGLICSAILGTRLSTLDRVGTNGQYGSVSGATHSVVSGTNCVKTFKRTLKRDMKIRVRRSPGFSPGSGAILGDNVILSIRPKVCLGGRFNMEVRSMVCIASDKYRVLARDPGRLVVLWGKGQQVHRDPVEGWYFGV